MAGKKTAIGVVLNKNFIFFLIILSPFVTIPLPAQASADALISGEIGQGANGLRTSLQNGNLTFGIPIFTIPGDVPIPVVFGFDGTLLPITRERFEPEENPPAGEAANYYMDRPIVRGIHFGYLTDNEDGAVPSTSLPAAAAGRGMVILENGRQIAEAQRAALDARPGLEGVLNLPHLDLAIRARIRVRFAL